VPYAELHCHSNFSFLDGASHPEDLVTRAAELGYRALAVTDHDGFYGAVRFHRAAQEAGLPAVYGTEVSPGGAHLVLLAPSPKGYAALSRLVTRAQLRGEKGAPIYEWEELAEVAAGGELVALSGCRQGTVPAAATRGDLAGAMGAAASLREVFADRLYLELWHHAMPEDDPRNDLVAEVAARLAIPVVATNNVHYHRRSEADLAEVLAAIGGRRDLDRADGFRPATDERYLKNPAEMARRLAGYPGAVETAVELGEGLAFDLRLVAPRLPDFPLPAGFASEMAYLRHLTNQGAREAYPDGAGGVSPAANSRLEHELGVIEELGYPGYFLVVWDLVRFARAQDIYCQIRGSGADAAVCRCLGLTRVDPIRLGLPFERFLSEERGRPPDIDLDLEAERREEVIQYCYRRYGRERAAMVANVITYRARSVLRDVGKAFGLTQAQVDGLSRYVDTRDPAHLSAEAPLPAGLGADLIYDVCRRLDGFPRHLGIHSGGMVIADRPLWEVVPLEWGRMEDRSVLQWDKDDCAEIGIVKFDLLGLGMLEAMHRAVDLIRESHGVEVDLARIPQEPEVYEMLTAADTVGVFQVESRAQMATLPRMKPRTFYDLAIEVALIRPGPIQGQSVHPFLRRRNGEEPVRYPHPLTKPVLEKTLGVPVFQEQLMELARRCAGFTGAQSDLLRQAMTHKRSVEAMDRLREAVYMGMASNGITGAAADEIWEKLQGFASFGFPESHSVSFAYLVYASAWLKHHWPTEFYCGLLNSQPMGFYSPNSLVQDAGRHGVVVLSPDVNRSIYDCTVVGAHGSAPAAAGRRPVALLMGLRYIRNLGEAEIARLEAAREVGGPFGSVKDLAQRTGLPVDALEGLAASGALASLPPPPGEGRAGGLSRREGLWAAGAAALLGPDRLPVAVGVEAPQLRHMTLEEEAQADLWATGVSVHHPVQFVRARLAELGCLTVAEALALRRNGVRARVAGIVTHRQRPDTARGVIFLNLEDETGLLNVVVLPEVWTSQREVARRRVGLVVEGRLEYRDGVTNLVAHRFSPWPGVSDEDMGVRSRDFR
jgi:error-prone DNA polymerase